MTMNKENQQEMVATHSTLISKKKKAIKYPVKTDIFVYNLIPYSESEP